MRTIYALRAAWQLKRASLKGGGGEKASKDYWQAGKSVAGIHRIEAAGEIVRLQIISGEGVSMSRTSADRNDVDPHLVRADELHGLHHLRALA
jgi:hypothetical protein